MKQEYEIIRYPKIKHIQIFIDEMTYRTQHLHADYEICFALDGSATFKGLKENIVVNKNEGVFFDSNEVHSISYNDKPMIGLFIQVSNHFLRDYLPELHNCSYQNVNLKEIIDKDKLNYLFSKAVLTAYDYFADAPNYRTNTVMYIIELLNYIFVNDTYSNLSPRDIENKKKNAKRLIRIAEYIDEHFQEQITLEDIANMEDITTTHLSHLFSSGFGVTFQDYLNERRFEYAIQLMKNSNQKIIEISYEAGFSDPKYLNKMFKKRFGLSPREFKKDDIPLTFVYSNKNKAILEKVYANEESIRYLKNYLDTK